MTARQALKWGQSNNAASEFTRGERSGNINCQFPSLSYMFFPHRSTRLCPVAATAAFLYAFEGDDMFKAFEFPRV